MTTSKIEHREVVRLGRKVGMSATVAGEIARSFRERARELVGDRGGFAWPSPEYAEDPVRFFREILGFEPWEKQIEISDLVLDAKRRGKRVAVKSGHKVGKSTICAALALWAYSSFPGVRVVLTAVTSRQVDGIIWREIRMLLARHGRCVACRRAAPNGPRPCPHSHLIEEEPGQLARTGLKAPDFREIVGFTAREAEGVAGVSGPYIVYICDEASGIPELIFQAIEGNRAGGAMVILISNPTRLAGEFFEAFHAKKDKFYLTASISSEDSPNVKAGRIVIPGLATRDWIEEKKAEWGEKSALFYVRAKGEFPLAEKGQVFSIEAIEASRQRWEEGDLDTGGPLCIGIDVAGESGEGDESGFAVRRGQRVEEILARRGLTADGHVVEALGLVAKHKQRNDEVRFIIDREGEPGAKVWGAFLAYAQSHPDARLILVGVRASERAQRDPRTYDRVRDELAGNLADWMRNGGALPPGDKLEADLQAFQWGDSLTGRSKLIDKRKMRERLGRSPDHADAVALSVWDFRYLPATADQEMRAETPGGEPEGRLDPYAGFDAGDDGGGFDPYKV